MKDLQPKGLPFSFPEDWLTDFASEIVALFFDFVL